MSNWHLRPETIAAHALKSTDEATGAVAPPIYPSSTYARDENYKPKLRENYIRNGNPTLWHAEDAIAALENGKGCLLFASGMAAITTLLETVPPGRHVVAPDVMYYGTRDWLKILEQRGRIALTLFDATKPGALEASIIPGKTDLVWIETPLNPTWDVIDIEAAAKAGACGRCDSRRRCDGNGCGNDATPGAWRRHRISFGYQVSQRPFRCAGRRVDCARADAALGRDRDIADQDRHAARSLRSVAAHPRASDRFPALPPGFNQCHGNRQTLRAASAGSNGCSIRALRAIAAMLSR